MHNLPKIKKSIKLVDHLKINIKARAAVLDPTSVREKEIKIGVVIERTQYSWLNLHDKQESKEIARIFEKDKKINWKNGIINWRRYEY